MEIMITFISRICLGLGVLGGILIAIRFNIITAKISRTISKTSQQEHRVWLFWRDRRQLLLFLFNPERLIHSEDSTAIASEKEKLIRHRKTLNKSILKSCASVIAGAILGIAIPLAYAFLTQK